MPVHIAITRRVRPGYEAEFERSLREFLRASFEHSAVIGAHMLVPLPGSDSREYGILRSFRNHEEREAFYASPLFREWERRAVQMTDGEPEYRQLHGLEAWFRSPAAPPPRWKMAVVTFAGVYPLTSLLPRLFARLLPAWHPLLLNIVVTGLIVAALTWAIMPVLTRILRGWLMPRKRTSP
ncbi:antibiotic biosynthesis monooxygenase [Opitutaceae bacterium EW11]|nr:antibiotic biosynthesis monooxygenase [Opitutaceae bacterium EW11]